MKKTILFASIFIALAGSCFSNANAKIKLRDLAQLDNINSKATNVYLDEDTLNEKKILRMYYRGDDLVSGTKFPLHLKAELYVFRGGNKKILKIFNKNLKKRRSAKNVIFTSRLLLVEDNEKIYIDLFDTNNRPYGTYTHTVDLIDANFTDELPAETDLDSITAASCSEGLSDPECLLEFFLQNVNFSASFDKKLVTQVSRDAQGSYNVLLPIKKGRRLKKKVGKFKVKGTNSGGVQLEDGYYPFFNTNDIEIGAIRYTDNGISFGVNDDPSAFNILNNGGFSISSNSLQSPLVDGAFEYDGTDLYFTANGQRLNITESLSAIANGNFTGIDLSNGGFLNGTIQFADTSMLNEVNLNGNSFFTNNSIAQFNGRILIQNGATTGLVLTSDANGFATWRAIPSSADNLGSHIAGTTLNLNGFSLINAQDVNGLTANFINGNFQNLDVSNRTVFGNSSTTQVNGELFIPNGSNAGFVLTSDTNGRTYWSSPLVTFVNGDDLGNHTAITSLDMDTYGINNIGRIHFPVGATNGYILTSDVNGVASWQNLNNLANNSISNLNGILLQNPTLNGLSLFTNNSTAQFNGQIIIPGGANTGFVLTTDANGVATWQAITNINNGTINNGALLGSSLQDPTINGKALFTNNSIAQFNGQITIPSGATTGFVLTTDANGVASWQAIPSSADNLGSHIAGTNLNLNGFSLINAQDINGVTANFTNGNFNTIDVSRNLRYQNGAAAGFILISDNNGNASWQDLTGISNGTFTNGTILGSYLQDPTINGRAFFTNNSIAQFNGQITIPSGATTGFVLTTDANGVASWQAIPSSADNLGSHIAGTNLNLNGFSLINAQDVNGVTANFANGNFNTIDVSRNIRYQNGAAAGFVLTSNANGDASWQAVTSVNNGTINNGTLLGSYLQDPTINGRAFFTNNSIAQFNGQITIPSGATTGFVLTTDANGVASWQAIPSSADNLGSHIAGTNLNLNGFSLINAQDVNGVTANFANGNFNTIDVSRNIRYQNGAAAGFVLTSNANGDASWQAVTSVNNGTINNGTLLGSYLQDPTINGRAFFTNNSIAQFNGQITIPSGATTGFVLTTDANGVASWQAIPSSADNLGSHIAGTNLNLNGFSLINAQDVNGVTANFANGNFNTIDVSRNISYQNGAAAGFVLTSNANGDASWQAVTSVNNGTINNGTLLGSYLQDPTINGRAFFTNNSTAQFNGQIIIPSGANTGFVLTTDANGVASWQVAAGADNLGNHNAEQNLNMNGFSLINAQDVNGNTANFINGNFNNGDFNRISVNSFAALNGAISIPTGASTGLVLTSDANGIATWQAIASINNGTVNNGTLLDAYLQDPTINGRAFFTNNSTAQFNGQIIIPSGANTGFVLTTDANGVATWQAIASINNGTVNNGTLLDAYLQDPTINGRAFFTNNSTAQFNGQIIIPSGANTGFVLTTDANGVASWQVAAGADNLGNHNAEQNLNMNGFSLVNGSLINAQDLNVGNGNFTNIVNSPLFNGGVFNGGAVNTNLLTTLVANGTNANFANGNFINLATTNLTTGNLNTANGSFTNIVNSPLFNGGVFNGVQANISNINSAVILTNTINGQFANFNNGNFTNLTTNNFNAANGNFANIVNAPLFNGGVFNGGAVNTNLLTTLVANGTNSNFANGNFINLTTTNLTTGNFNAANGTFTNIVNSPLFNGGVFNGAQANINNINSTLILTNTINGQFANFNNGNFINLTANDFNAANGNFTNIVNAPLFNGGIFNGEAANITNITAQNGNFNTINANSINGGIFTGTLQDPVINGLALFRNGGMARFNGQIMLGRGAVNGYVLTSDANGIATWQVAPGIDNLGNHNAEQNLNMNGFSLVNGAVLNAQDINAGNGDFTNIVNSALFNGGVFNGGATNVNVLTTLVANGTNANFANGNFINVVTTNLTTGNFNAANGSFANIVNSPLFNGGVFNGGATNVNVLTTLVANGTNANFANGNFINVVTTNLTTGNFNAANGSFANIVNSPLFNGGVFNGGATNVNVLTTLVANGTNANFANGNFINVVTTNLTTGNFNAANGSFANIVNSPLFNGGVFNGGQANIANVNAAVILTNTINGQFANFTNGNFINLTTNNFNAANGNFTNIVNSPLFNGGLFNGQGANITNITAQNGNFNIVNANFINGGIFTGTLQDPVINGLALFRNGGMARFNGEIMLGRGAANGYVLTSDANGVATWQVSVGVDNLGNHNAEMNLNLNGFSLVNGVALNAQDLNVGNGNFTNIANSPLFNGGVFNGGQANIANVNAAVILTNTINGQFANFTNGNFINLTTNNFNAANGNFTNIVNSPLFNGGLFNGQGANITNITAQNGNFNIVNANFINGGIFTGTLQDPVINGLALFRNGGMARFNGEIMLGRGAANGYVLTSDANGVATWQVSVGVDNLGNHNAEMNINLNGYSLVNGVALNAQNLNVGNGNFTNIANSPLFNGGVFNGGATNVNVLTTLVANGTNANFANGNFINVVTTNLTTGNFNAANGSFANIVNSPLFNGGVFNGGATNVNVLTTLVANGTNANFANGNFGTITTALTEGSVVFAGTNGTLSEDNANFYYDIANGRLGIGTTIPTQALDIRGNVHLQKNMINGEFGFNVNTQNIVAGTVDGFRSSLNTTGNANIVSQQNSTGVAAVVSRAVSTGDAVSRWEINGVTTWTAGVDNSDNDKFKIINGTVLGSNDLLTILKTGELGIGTNNPNYDLEVNGTTSTLGFIMPTGAANGLVLTSDANGVASWSTSVPSDNLGNHNAEMNLNLNGFSLVNGVNLNAQNLNVGNGNFTNIVNSPLYNGGVFNGGAANVNILTTLVANGTNANFANGNFINVVTTNLTTGNFNAANGSFTNIVNAPLFNGGVFNGGAANVNTLTTLVANGTNANFANGNFINVVTTNLTTGNFNAANGSFTNIVNAPLFNGGTFNGGAANIAGTITAITLNGIEANISGAITATIFNGVEANIANGNFTTINAAVINGGTFTGTLQDPVINGLALFTNNSYARFNGALQISSGANNQFILTSDANGVATWVDPTTLPNNGDDLGSHIANQGLTMSGFTISNADQVNGNTANFSTGNFTTIVNSALFNGGVFNGGAANVNVLTTLVANGTNANFANGNFINVITTNLTTSNFNAANGNFTNIVNSPLFNGGVFNGGAANLTGTVTAATLNGIEANIARTLTAATLNGIEANIARTLTAATLNGTEANITTINATNINGGTFTGTLQDPFINGLALFNLNNQIRIVNGATQNFVLASDAAGNATWTDLTTLPSNGDDLGNHRADFALDMNGYTIYDADQINGVTANFNNGDFAQNLNVGTSVTRGALTVNGSTAENSGIVIAGLAADHSILRGNVEATGVPTVDRFRISHSENYGGANIDYLVIDKTDGNDADPDGGIVFTNTGNDGVRQTSLQIYGNRNFNMYGATVRATGNDFRIGQNLYHDGDTDTYLRHNDDNVQLVAGGEVLLDLIEGAQDSVEIGDGGDVDVNINNDIFYQGSSGRTGFNTTNPTDTIDVRGSITTNGFVMPDGAVANYVLTTDATGFAYWAEVIVDGNGLTANAAGTVEGAIQFRDSVGNMAADETTFFWDRGTESLAIGNASPSYKLDVTGDGNFNTNLTIGEYFLHRGDTNTNTRFRDDQYTVNVGGETMIDIVEDAVQDSITLGDGGDIDINLNNDLTIDAASSNVTIGANLLLGQYLYHSGDTDTNLRFQGDDIEISAGGERMIDLHEDGTQDILTLGDGGDIDINFNNDMFLEASSSRIGVGTIAPRSDFDVNGTTTTNAFIMPTGATIGYVLSSDAAGNATWTDLGALSSNGDNLGNHAATQALDMRGFTLFDADQVNGNTANFNTISLATGASNNFILRSDATGNATWVDPNTIPANGDDLGTHAATQALDMRGFTLFDADQVNGNTANFNTISLATGASNNFILRSDATGNATWVDPNTIPANGDDLGTHAATQALDMRGFTLFDADQVNGNTANFNTISLATGAGVDRVLRSDATGNATWVDPTTLPANGDDLGNHTATQALDMAGFSLTNADQVNGATANFTTVNSNTISLATGAGVDRVLRSDATGNATWVDPTTLPANGDDLGNHTATQALDMAGFSLTNADQVNGATANFTTVNSNTISLATGAGVDRVLRSDATGNATWVDPTTLPANGDDLGNHTATQALDMAGFSLTNADQVNGATANFTTVNSNTISLATGAGIDRVLRSDATGNATWVDPTTLPANGDDLGNHTATQALDMAGFSVTNADQVNGTTANFNTISLATGAALDRVLRSDATGNATWVDPTTLPANGDDLGNHTATQAVDMAGFTLNNADQVNGNTANFNTISLATGAGVDRVLRSDATGNATWVDIATLPGNGDDLGNHTATQAVDMAGFTLNNADQVNGNTANFNTISLATGASVDRVLRSDATGNATWINQSTMNVGNADTLDSLDATDLLRSNTSDNYTSGTLTLDSGTEINAAAGSTVDIDGDLEIADTNVSLNGASTTLTQTTGDITLAPAAGSDLNVTLSAGGIVDVAGNLTVASLVRSVPTDAPGTCDGTTEGSMYYDASQNEPCFCDGANWQQFDGGGTCP